MCACLFVTSPSRLFVQHHSTQIDVRWFAASRQKQSKGARSEQEVGPKISSGHSNDTAVRPQQFFRGTVERTREVVGRAYTCFATHAWVVPLRLHSSTSLQTQGGGVTRRHEQGRWRLQANLQHEFYHSLVQSIIREQYCP